MCAVSMIHDSFLQRWDIPQITPYQFPENPTKVALDWPVYKELVRKAEEYDKRTQQPNCIKPQLDGFEQKMEDFLKKKGLV